MSDYPQLEYGTLPWRAPRAEAVAGEPDLTCRDETGGLAIVNAGESQGGLGRIVLDNSRYYLLGYRSDSHEMVHADSSRLTSASNVRT